MAAAAILVGYLLGSIPTAYLVGRLFGKDVRRSGSGTVGAWNVARLAGGLETDRKNPAGLIAAALVAAVDAGKGYAAVEVARRLGAEPAVVATAGLAAVVGHMWMLFLGFRGGKGVATASGVLLALAPRLFALAALIFAAAFALARNRAVGVAAAAFTVPVILFFAMPTLEWFGFSVALAALIVGRMAGDLRRFVQERGGGSPKE